MIVVMLQNTIMTTLPGSVIAYHASNPSPYAELTGHPASG
jgi:hypothetical protein